MLCYDFSHFCPLKRFVMDRYITYYTQSTVCQSGFYERISSIIFLSSSPWRMQDLPRGGNFLWGLRREKFLEWCNLERFGANFYTFLLSKGLKILILYTKIMINYSHILARGSMSMIHCPLIIFIKECNL